MEYSENLKMAERLARAVQEAGGTAYYVGGLVRDRIMGRDNKDFDLEIHGITPEKLEAVLDTLGERQMFGASFGVYNLRHYDLDIAMPRKEFKTGERHRDFRCDIDPFCGTEKAAMRRDFTINAMMQNVLTGEIIDHYGGIQDIEAGIIRHVNPVSFMEDALRVLRAAQFAARFCFTIAPETLALCSRMDLSALAGERVKEETAKALLKAEKPSIFFELLREMEQMDVWFPELSALVGVQQSPQHHPEGDAWRHTMLVIDGAATLRSSAGSQLPFMLSAALHDCGKAVTTQMGENGHISSIMHEKKGVPLADRFLTRLRVDKQTEQYVLNMVSLHMKPHILTAQHSKVKSFMKMMDESVSPEDLLLLAKADRIGQLADMNAYAKTEQELKAMLVRYREVIQRQREVAGKDLVEAGFKPGRQFSDILEYAHKLWLAGIPYERALPMTIGYAEKTGR